MLHALEGGVPLAPHVACMGRACRPGDRTSAGAEASTSGADWVKARDRVGSRGALYAVALSSDGKYLTVGGGDKKVGGGGHASANRVIWRAPCSLCCGIRLAAVSEHRII